MRKLCVCQEGNLTFIKAVDNFLIALVLLIFCLGIYELFVSKINPLHKQSDEFNYWFRVSSLEDLKKYFGKVVLMILIVNFFEKSAQVEYTAPIDLLFLGGGVLMIAISLFLTHEKPHTAKVRVAINTQSQE